MANNTVSTEARVADLRARGMHKAADRVVASRKGASKAPVANVDLLEFEGRTVTVTPQTRGTSFESGAHTVVVTEVTLDKSSTGSAWVRFELTLTDSNRRAFSDISVAGGNLETIDVLAFRLTGSRLSSLKGTSMEEIALIKFLLSLKGKTLSAWIRQDRLDNGARLLKSSVTRWYAAS